MNDFSEVGHGFDCLKHAYEASKAGQALQNVLETLFPGLTAEITSQFSQVWSGILGGTYLSCFSEHDGKQEDLYGRLSMWRAYGGGTGIALVLNHEPFFNESNAFNAFTSPVAYLGKVEFEEEIQRVADNIAANFEFVRKLDRNHLIGLIVNTFRFAVLSTKHLGFKEEREWRVIYTPGLGGETRLQSAIETVNGVPQPVYKLPLKNIPELGLEGIEVREILDRVIIGPTNYARVIKEAFVRTLVRLKVENARDKVVISEVPLRGN